MAKSGRFEYVGSERVYWVSWRQTATNIYENYSTVTIDYYASTADDNLGSITVDSMHIEGSIGTETFETPTQSITLKRSLTLIDRSTHIIKHNTDGTASVYSNFTFREYGVGSTLEGYLDLDPIPRGASIISASDVVLGNNCNIVFKPSTSTSYYSLSFSIGNWSMSTELFCPGTTNQYTYNGYTISGTKADSNGNTIYGQLPNATSGVMTVTLVTYVSNDINTVFGSSSKTFVVIIPDNITPTIGTVTLAPQTYGILLQNNNALSITASGCQAGNGSEIASYTYSGPGISETTKRASFTSNPIFHTGNLTYTITVTDTRGRTASTTKTITCYPYAAPSVSFSAYRSNANGTENNSGAYIACSYTPKFSSVNGTNDVTVTIFYKKNSATSVSSTTVLTDSKSTSTGTKILSSIDLSSTYIVYAVTTDNYGGRSQSTIITVFSGDRTMNILSDGTGVAFGKMAESSRLLDSAWAIQTHKPEQTMKNLSYRNTNLISSTANDTTANWGAHGNLATTLYNKDGQITDQPSKSGFMLNLTDGPNSSEVHQIWATQGGGALAHRGGNSSGWNGTWRTVLDSENYSNYIDISATSWSDILDKPTTISGYGITDAYTGDDVRPTELYSNSVGTTGSITLYDSAANFTYLEVYYTDNDDAQPHSVKMYAPNGKNITLSCIEPDIFYQYPTVNIHTSKWTISENTVTPVMCTRWIMRNIELEPSFAVTEDHYVKITRILGYK